MGESLALNTSKFSSVLLMHMFEIKRERSLMIKVRNMYSWVFVKYVTVTSCTTH